jgi:cell division protein FtsL
MGAQLVIYSSFERRTLVNELHRLQQQRDAMQVEWGQLLLEQSALTAYTRVETLVTSRLQMRTPQAHEVVIARPK